jgi:hypothetical protein
MRSVSLKSVTKTAICLFLKDRNGVVVVFLFDCEACYFKLEKNTFKHRNVAFTSTPLTQSQTTTPTVRKRLNSTQLNSTHLYYPNGNWYSH